MGVKRGVRSTMAESTSLAQSINPCLLHLQKMGLELKCPTCLNLLSQPLLLPCNHIVCSPCRSRSLKSQSDCPVCKLPYRSQELRPAPHIENLARIYRNMEAAFYATLLHSESQIYISDLQNSEKHGNAPGKKNIDEKLRKVSGHKIHRENLYEFQATTSFPCNKRVQVSPNPIENEAETPERLIKSSKSRGETGDFATLNGENCVGNAEVFGLVREEAPVDEEPAEFSPFSWLRDQEYEEKEIEHGATNNPMNIPCSSCLFINHKDSDSESNDRRIKNNDEKSSTDRSNKKGYEDGGDLQTSKSCSPSNPDPVNFETELSMTGLITTNKRASPLAKSYFRESKRQNIGSDNDITGINISVADSKSGIVCAFCQSSKDSEDSGPMLHYKYGRPVVADQVFLSDVLHVHKGCAEWAPDVYFVNENVKNLEAEVVRGRKIKCSGCGLKGAALGCYAKSCRRSYHVPCAVGIPECRWDTDNFIMLCPVHSSYKFPSERLKPGKKARSTTCSLTTPLTHQESSGNHPSSTNEAKKLWSDAAGTSNQWVLCGCSLSIAEKDLVAELARLTGASVSKRWSPNVTHLISSTDENGACGRTLKFLMAILAGRWILKMDWIKACMDSMHPVSEEPYEVQCDIHGYFDGPKNGRSRILQKAPQLFEGKYVYFTGDFEDSYKAHLVNLVRAAGGTVKQEGSLVSEICGTEGTSSTIVIYNVDILESGMTKQESTYVLQQRLQYANDLAEELGGAEVRDHPWFLDSIAASKLQP